MKVFFNNDYLECLFQGKPVKGKPKFQKDIIHKFKKVIAHIENANTLIELNKINSLNIEKLKGNMIGYYSARVDIHYRLIFSVENNKITLEEIINIEDLTNHYQ